MTFSTMPFLVAAIISFPVVATSDAYRRHKISKGDVFWLLVYSVPILLWTCFSAYWAQSGYYKTDAFLSLQPTAWIPLVPLVLVAIPLVISGRVRSALFRVGLATPLIWFAMLQATRIAALGTAIKTYRGEFPEIVELWAGIPDLLFGLSAIAVIYGLKSGRISNWAWYVWNWLGVLIIVPVGMIVINLSMPGLFQLYPEPPTFAVAFEFPLALAPTLVVPLQVAGNIWAIVNYHFGYRPRQGERHSKQTPT